MRRRMGLLILAAVAHVVQASSSSMECYSSNDMIAEAPTETTTFDPTDKKPCKACVKISNGEGKALYTCNAVQGFCKYIAGGQDHCNPINNKPGQVCCCSTQNKCNDILLGGDTPGPIGPPEPPDEPDTADPKPNNNKGPPKTTKNSTGYRAPGVAASVVFVVAAAALFSSSPILGGFAHGGGLENLGTSHMDQFKGASNI